MQFDVIQKANRKHEDPTKYRDARQMNAFPCKSYLIISIEGLEGKTCTSIRMAHVPRIKGPIPM